MDCKFFIILWIAVIPFSQGLYVGGSCSTDQIRCRSGTQCVAFSNVCTGNGAQCNDGSDEDPSICEFWESSSSSRCSSGNLYCSRNGNCYSARDFCRSSSCKNENLCQIIDSGILYVTKEEDTGMALTEQLVALIQKSVNVSSNSTQYCPMFYTRVGKACLSFFSPAKIPWPEARQFCLSIGGDLISVGSMVDYDQLLDFMREAKFTTSYWTGGRFDVDVNAWAWVYNDGLMPLGSPFWATRYSSSCIPRSPPHIDPFSSPALAVPGAPCYKYIQAPAQRSAGWCAAMTYEHYYYFTDESCQENRSPLCIFTGHFGESKSDNPLQ